MEIKRSVARGRYHELVEYGDFAYLYGVTSDKEGIKEQVTEVLQKIDALLAQAGSDKDHILRATIYLKDMKNFDAMNSIWDAWLNNEHAPVRATVQASMVAEKLLVEIVVEAVKRGGR